MELRRLSLRKRKQLGIPFYKRGVRWAKSRIVHVKAHTRRYPLKKYKPMPLPGAYKPKRRRRRTRAVRWTTGLEEYV